MTRWLPILLLLSGTLFPLHAEEPADLSKLFAKANGNLIIPEGNYRITEPLVFDLRQGKGVSVRAESGPVTIVMAGPGPAIRIIGSHEGTASPSTFQPETWKERMPIIEGIEILGDHAEADGIELVRCMQPIITRVAVRWCRHGIRLRNRNRNVIISDCHLYENSGIGLYLDDVNLHQINISNSHISYNREGGIVVQDGNVRNLHITGCDIEGNMPADDTPTKAANILLDVSGSPDDKSKSIAEIAITGCTIQHSSNYTGDKYEEIAPGGANIRILGKEIWPIDSVTISGNVISDTSTHVVIDYATDITLTGNNFFAPNPDNVHVSNSKRIIVNGNTFNPRQFDRPGRLVFHRSEDCIISNNTFRALKANDGAIQLRDSKRMNLIGNILTECQSGITIRNSEMIQIENWIVGDLPEGIPFLDRK